MSDNDNEFYERAGARRLPRWLVVLLVVLAVIGLLFIAMMLLGGLGGHGPGRHMGAAAAALTGSAAGAW